MTYLLISVVMVSPAFAQQRYEHAIGARIGSGYYDVFSASYKTFIGASPSALEFNLGFKPFNVSNYSWVNLSLSATYQYHINISAVEGLSWFVGGGLTAYNSFSDHAGYSGFGLEIYPTGGVDYQFRDIPLNLSVDFRPGIQIIKPYDYYDNVYFTNFGIAARYIF